MKEIKINRHCTIIFSLLFFLWTSISWAQPRGTGIRVLSPLDGAVFEPGQTVTVIVQPEGSTSLQVVGVVTHGVITGSFNPPFHVPFSVPRALGSYKLQVTGKDDKDRLFDVDLTYHVETAMAVTSIRVISTSRIGRPASVNLIGGVMEERLDVEGTFTDGTTRDISKSKEITYVSSNPQVATVSSDGLIKAVAEGTATLTVTYKGKSVTVPVKVEFQRQSIKIDIMPGSSINRINLDSGGSIPVAILTTQTFDVTRVDPLSVRFGPNGAVETHGRGHFEDVDGDGFSDMVLHFRIEETGIQCLQKLATLTGSTIDGVLIKGTDFIRPRGNNCIEIPHR